MKKNYSFNFLNSSVLYKTLFVLSLFFWGIQAHAQYCTPAYSIGCTSQDDINSFTLTGVGASSISDLNTGCGPGNGYEDRTTAVAAVDLMQGGTFSGTITTNYSGSEYYSIWIDFNNDNTFSVSEILVPTQGPFGSTLASTFSLTLPITASIGIHRMRVRLVYANPGFIDPCTSYTFGETHDYNVNVLMAPPCSGAPSITSISPTGPIASCAGVTQTLSLSIAVAGGYNFQWQTSATGTAPWTNIPGATNTNYSFTVTGNASFRAYVTCTNSSLADTSLSVAVTAAPPSFAALPYVQDFENWQNYCATSDVPASTTGAINWTNQPATGDSSWRRDDQGNTAGWTSFGNYTPASYSGLHSARYPTDANFTNSEGALDLFLDCSSVLGNKQLYFHYINEFNFNNGDSLVVLLSDNNGLSFTQIGGFDSASFWTLKSLPIASNSAQTIVRFKAKKYAFDYSDIGIDSLFVVNPCSGAPVAGNISPAGPINSCPENNFTLQTTGGTVAGNINYTWQQSINGGAIWTSVTGGNGANTFIYTTPQLFDTIQYRLIVTCLGSTLSDTSAFITINIASPTYATLPFVEGFENWTNFCDVQDVPSNNWLNKPSSGDMSWRRDDEGASASWNTPGYGSYNPPSIEGLHSARIHTSYGNFNTIGNLDLFVNCSNAGPKELQFHYINPSGFDQLDVLLSIDGGVTFNNLTTLFNNTNWTLQSIPFTSTSATTVIRFSATYDFSDDIGIDYVKVLLPCSGMPVAGIVDSLTPCSGVNFNLSTTGGTVAAALAYQWQQSTNGTTWVNATNGTSPILSANITVPTYFRLITICSTDGMSDTSAPRLLQLATFYYCYCQQAAQYGDDDDIGNVNISKYPSNVNVLNNGIATPLINNPTAVNSYTNFTNLVPVSLYKDSVYNINVTHIAEYTFFGGGTVAAYIDFDHDGTYNISTERILFGSTNNATQSKSDTFTIPNSTPVGITGMRIVLASFGSPTPCGTYFYGETEDYLVNIDNQPCNGPANAGAAYISDTLLCMGEPFILFDTSHERLFGNINWIWQSSTDNINFTDIPGTLGMDTLMQNAGTVKTYYRLKVICSNTNSETFSNVHSVNVKAFFQCYCPSFAIGGTADISDVGAFSIGTFVINSGGPHLYNPVAVKPYTDFTNGANPIYLIADSSYNVSFYHTIHTGNQEDAKITMFMDFNNNHQYDIPEERVYTGFTNSSDIFLNGTVSIPANIIKDSITGMRVIINSNTGPNTPSDDACGTYNSGETEDYIVMFKDISFLNVANTESQIATMDLYPNPNKGKFIVSANFASVQTEVILSVTDVNGRVIAVYNYQSVDKYFKTQIDLSNNAKGLYFLNLKAGVNNVTQKLIIN